MTNLALGKMNINQLSRRDDTLVREYEDGDEPRIVADLGTGVEVSVEVVDDTAIIVFDDGEQMDLDLPESGAQAFIKNGILTIELEGQA